MGLGLRWELADELLERRPAELDFLEITPENYLGRGGAARRTLDRARASYPLLSHGLSLSLGGSDPLARGHLDDLRSFFADYASPWHSDHACMTSDAGRMLHDLLPLPLTRASAAHVADRVKAASDRLGMPVAVENVSFYLSPGRSELGEPEFMREICERADCGLLFDVNNAVVNAKNFGLDVRAWLDRGPLDRVVQIHVAGHEWFDFAEGELHAIEGPHAPAREGADRLIVDTHGADAPDDVLAFLEAALEKIGPVPIVIERDQNIPSVDALLAEARRVRQIAARALSRRA